MILDKGWWHLDEAEIQAELDAVWPAALPRPTQVAHSQDGSRTFYGWGNEAKGAGDAS